MTMRISIGALLRSKQEQGKTSTPAPSQPLPGSELLGKIRQAEQAGDKNTISSLFTQAHKAGLRKVETEATDAMGRLLRGEPCPSAPKPTANPIKALSQAEIQRREAFKLHQIEVEKTSLVKEYCTIMKQASFPAGMAMSLADLRTKVRSARKAVAPVGGGKIRGRCGGKQKKAKASNKK